MTRQILFAAAFALAAAGLAPAGAQTYGAGAQPQYAPPQFYDAQGRPVPAPPGYPAAYPAPATPGYPAAYPPASPQAGYPPQPYPPPAYPPQQAYPATQPAPFSSNELVSEGHRIFGDLTEGLATLVEHAIARYGLPNGYILGQEGGGAIIGGARYGEGVLYTKNAGQHRVFWQGPSIGLDVGANGVRTMMLVYNLPSVDAIYDRFIGLNGSAYAVAGLGMTVLSRNQIYVVPIVSGVGARLGINFGYLKFTHNRTWNPF